MRDIQSKVCPGETTTFCFSSRDVDSGDEFQIMRCDDSGTYFTHPQPDDLNRYYPQNYRGFHPLVERVFLAMYARYATAVTKRLGAPGRILEIGCGAGWMLEAFARQGWEATGFERTPEIAREINERTGLRVLCGEIDDIDHQKGYDIILLYNVLEHLTDPHQVIASSLKLLNPAGSLIITLPNILSWQARLTQGNWFHLDVPRHLFHFSEASLKSLLKTHGLEVRSMKITSFPLDVFGWVQSLQNMMLPWPNGLHRLLSQGGLRTIFRPKGVVIAGLTLLLAAPALAASVAGMPSKRGALMEMWASPKEFNHSQ